jgi:hypothetical protein
MVVLVDPFESDSELSSKMVSKESSPSGQI